MKKEDNYEYVLFKRFLESNKTEKAEEILNSIENITTNEEFLEFVY